MICCILILKVISRHSTSYLSCIQWKVGVMLFNTTFNNISVISWLSDLLVEETGVPRENHRPVTSHWQMLSHNAVSNIPRTGFELTTLVVISTDCTVNPTTMRSQPRWACIQWKGNINHDGPAFNGRVISTTMGLHSMEE